MSGRPLQPALCAIGLAGVIAGCAAPPPAATKAAFPLRVESGKRHLVDALGQPFLIVGDTAWSLEVNADRADIVLYLDDRVQKGFNTILFSAMEHCFTRLADLPTWRCGDQRNLHGEAPFAASSEGAYDFAKPNEPFWRNVDDVVAEASRRNLLLLIAPAYLGQGGGGEGWHRDMLANGPASLDAYGRFLGERYKGFKNIIWVEGGDFAPPDMTHVGAVVAGINSAAPDSLHTYHSSRGLSALDTVGSETWLGLNALYTDELVAKAARSNYARSTMPFFLIEAWYENEWASGYGARKQAYQAILGGATGQLLGTRPVWAFKDDWQAALQSDGAKSISTLGRLFSKLDWWRLIPDREFAFETAIQGAHPTADDDDDYFTVSPAAVTADGSFGVIYNADCWPGRMRGGGTCLIPGMDSEIRRIGIDLSKLVGPRVRATWIDPSSGAAVPVGGSPFHATGPIELMTPGKNAAGDTDWILLFESIS
jgi:hypothetical protein